MPLVQRFFFFFKWLKGSIPLVQRFFFIWKFFSFFRKDLGILNFFFLNFFFKYIHEQSTSNATWIFRIQRNIEIWNKQTNFKLNHDIANQMWSGAKLGHLLLLDPFRMLETWHAWTLIMIKWLGLALGKLEPWLQWNGLGLHLECMYLVSFWPLMLIMRIHFWWAQVLGLDSFKKQLGFHFK